MEKFLIALISSLAIEAIVCMGLDQEQIAQQGNPSNCIKWQ